MGRWLRRFLLVAAALLLVFHVGGGWYFSGELYDRALSGEERRASLELDPDLVVAALEGETIVLRTPDGSDAPTGLALEGVWGLRWVGGAGLLGEILRSSEDGVARDFVLLEGDPPVAGQDAELDPRAYPTPEAAGVSVEDVLVDGPLGHFPAWFADGDRPTWVIVIHGNSMSRLDNVRWLPALGRAGYPTLTITYRNDAGAPEDPSGLLRYGSTEWADLDAAVRYALEQGAEEVVLFGDSMGGAVIAAFLQRSELTPYVGALVLDAPALDFGQAVDDNAAREPLVGPINVPPTLTATAKWLAAVRYDVDWAALDYLEDPSIFDLPTFVMHGTDDLTVPIATSRRLAAAAPETVTLVECPGADHIECWNLDPEAAEERVLDFLAENLGSS